MNTTRRQILYGAALLGVAGCGSSNDTTTINPASAQTAPSPAATTTSGRLYVAHAEGGTLSGNVLTLVDTRPNVAWFEDRPGRRAGKQTTASFVADWAALGFASVPPNAALEIGGQSIPLVLLNPVYDVASGTLRFIVQPDQGVQLSNVPSSFADVSLFIDNAGSSTATKNILIEADRLPAYGELAVFIPFGPVTFVLSDDSSGCEVRADSIYGFGLSYQVASASSSVDRVQKVTMKLRLQSTTGQGNFTLTNIGSQGSVVTAQVPVGAAPRELSASGTQFTW